MSMNVNGVNSAVTTNTTTATSNTSTASQAANNTEVASDTQKEADAAVYEKSSSKTKYAPDTKTMEKIKADVLAQTENLRNLVSKLISKQGDTWNNAFDFLVDIDEDTRKEAQDLISEDGYFGVKQTTERLIGFAKAISGGDPSKIDELRGAVEAGFKSAEKIWGGKLPDICQKTYDSVMAEFDKWKQEATGVAAVV